MLCHHEESYAYFPGWHQSQSPHWIYFVHNLKALYTRQQFCFTIFWIQVFCIIYLLLQNINFRILHNLHILLNLELEYCKYNQIILCSLLGPQKIQIFRGILLLSSAEKHKYYLQTEYRQLKVHNTQ